MSDSQTINIGFKTEKPFVPLYVSRRDTILGSIVFGFFLGFVIEVTWRAVLETKRASRVSGYIVMLWLAITANTTYAVIAWCYLQKFIPPNIGVFLTCIICWIFQVQCLMLIIVNRLCIIIQKPSERLKLKLVVVGIVSLISISTSCIWIPAQLQINSHYMSLNHWWDKFEKAIYLLLDLSLNVLFIRMVKSRLVDHGLTKYDRVMRFNQRIIVVSIGMDILLMIATTLKNPFVYTQFHPVTYIVKLQIEISMSRLLIKVARSTGINVYNEEKGYSDSIGTTSQTQTQRTQGTIAVNITTQVHTQHDPEIQEEYEMSDTHHKDDQRDEAFLSLSSVDKIAGDERCANDSDSL
ncbi:uncharacterized protein BT62DRAFT_994173 [Guyanagaster necrorhizus]|uniref:Integral membrane protein n=1 Tax=Guyanagaster necrorhizus TaxID=856835 RepID=A0A9P7VUB2_9AGAR|nr:uncharacterized protein BT62DRAFT_994173 [Guyanagaster necrorhizus MCA 3950]KAG7446595.1 hypothetical protein BT62DRAFT_994173 [Guyanagaster necrorhizus MCA 3950]